MNIQAPSPAPLWAQALAQSAQRAVDQLGPIFVSLRPFTVATKPDATLWPYKLIIVSDETGGATIELSDGVSWLVMLTTAAALTGYVPTSRQVLAGTGMTGGGDLSADRTLTLADTAVTPGAYTSANITVDQQGRITAAASGSAFDEGQADMNASIFGT